LAEFPLAEAIRGKNMTVEWMPFELRPEPHPTLRPEDNYLQTAWRRSVYPLAERMGVEIHLPPTSPQPHTHLAWEGFQFAKAQRRGNEYNHRVLKAFFVEGQDIGQIDVLTHLANEIGIDASEFREALDSRRYRAAHLAALREAQDLGITGVPAFQIGDGLLVGVQSREALEAALHLVGID
jgi:predicted DsbA family dithiol-disulfide isomerase